MTDPIYSYHDTEVEGSIHQDNNWTVATHAELLALTGMAAADLKKLALVEENWATWRLTQITPAVIWTQVSGPPPIHTHSASVSLTAQEFEGHHYIGAGAVDLTLAPIVAGMEGKKARLWKYTSGDTAFVANIANTMADGSPGGRLQNTSPGEAKIAFVELTVLNLTEYGVEWQGSWSTT